jgi:myo-inositol catabolism protein IolC
MKTTISAIILTVLVTASLVAQTEPRQLVDQQKHMQMIQMTRDSSLMEMMMSHIAANPKMRRMIMEKIAANTAGDKEAMQELCQVIMKGSDEHSRMKEKGCGMMKHDAMKGNDSNKDTSKEEDEHKLHKH